MSTDVLRELVALTPMPPEALDADEIIAAFEAMFSARQDVLVTLSGKLADTDENRRLVGELATRDAAWELALRTARDAVGVARQGTSRLRSYAR
jgi:hypothetical protein